MLRDQGGDQVETLDDFRINDEKEDSQMVNLLSIIKNTGGQEAEETQALMTNQIQTDCIYHYSEAYEKMESEVRLPQLLAMQVERVELDLKHLEVNQPKGDEKALLEIRKKTVERVYRMTMAVRRSQSKMTEAERKEKQEVDEVRMEKRYAKAKKELSKRLKPSVKITSKSERKMRTRKEVDYTDEAKTHPNWKRDQKESKLNPVNSTLERIRKPGVGTVEVRESLVQGDSGWGLFAAKKITAGSDFCTYEGVELPESVVRMGYGNRDSVASAIKDHRTGEMIYVDGQSEAACYGRFAQDPIDELLVNAKILWRKGKLVDIAPGDEIYVQYGLEYWRDRLDVLTMELRERIEVKCTQTRVHFREECTVAEYKEKEPPSYKDGMRVRSEGVPLQQTPENYQTRLEKYEDTETDDSEQQAQERTERLQEEFSYENVLENE
jgi:hypothetical protein